MTQTCPQCASPNANGSRFCTRCGSPLEAAAWPLPFPDETLATSPCPQCTTPNSDGSSYCTACGFHIAAYKDDPFLFTRVCQGCHIATDPSYTYCHRCGLLLPQSLLLKAEASGSPAGFRVRLVAFLIDQAVLFIFLVVLGSALQGGPDRVFDYLAVNTGDAVLTFLAVIIPVLYYTVGVGMWGYTPGKAVLGLRVVRANGSRVGYRRAFGRYLAYTVSALPLGLGFLSIVLSAQKRGWHDFLCDTRVVHIER